MARKDDNFFTPPYQDEVVGTDKKLSFNWETFFRFLSSAIAPLGIEKSFPIKDNQATALPIEGLQFDFEKVNCVMVDFFIQRVGMGPGSDELLESGVLHLIYKPRSATWGLTKVNGANPGSGGVTFTIDSKGQVLYTTTNATGDFSVGISKVTYRARILSAKYAQPKFGWL